MASILVADAESILCNHLPKDSITEFAQATTIQIEEDGRYERILGLSTKSVGKNDVILEIPLFACPTLESFQKLVYPHLSQEEQEELNEMMGSRASLKAIILILFHASSSQASSAETVSSTSSSNENPRHWKAYFNTLPKTEDFQHLPTNWTSERIDKFGPLVADMLRSFVKRFQNEIITMFNELVQVVEYLHNRLPTIYPSDSTDVFDVDFVQWCMCNTNTRVFDFTSYDHTDTSSTEYNPGCVPFIDLCNHHPNASLTISIEHVQEEDQEGKEDHISSRQKVVRARATRDLVRGDELTINYHGSLQEMIHYLFYYGFVPNENVQNIMYYHTIFNINDNEEVQVNYLLDALERMGLPRTDQFALPADVNDSLPNAWIYLLYFQELWMECNSTNNYDTLKNISNGTTSLRLSKKQEVNAWNNLLLSVNTSTAWYTNALKKCKELDNEEDGDDSTILLKVYTNALEILKNTKMKALEAKAASGN
jgi:hypothetical protein